MMVSNFRLTSPPDKKYNKFYFLHIPKTGGRYLNEIAIYPISGELKARGINWLNTEDHDGWIKEIDEDTYTVCILRDPVKTACSFFLFFYDNGNLQKLNLKNDAILNQVRLFFFQFLKRDLWIHNMQSKFLKRSCADLPIEESFNYPVLDKDLLYERFNSISFLFTQDYLESNPLDVANRIFDDIGIHPSKINITKTDEFRQPSSKILYDSLSQDEIDLISSYFEFDYEIYNLVRSREISNTDV
jgi:hypothetical protein